MTFKRSILLLIFTCLISAKSFGTHILSGEITYKEIQDGKYLINLNILFDCINGNPNAINSPVDVAIYNDSSKLLITTLRLQKKEGVTKRTQFRCPNTRRSHCTQSIDYQAEVNIGTKHPGLAIIYQRCCRVNSKNILNSLDEGMTIMCSIPPSNLKNKVSALKMPSSLIVCTGNNSFPIEIDSSDYDSDSISVEFITPISGGSKADPVPMPMDYKKWPPRNVNYTLGYSSAFPFGKNGSLDIVNDSMQIKLADEGTYYMAVKIQEWRNSKIIHTRINDYLIYANYCYADTFDYAKNLSANPTSDSSIKLIWRSCYSKTEDPLEYEVYRSLRSNMADSIIIGSKNSYDSKPNEFINDINVVVGKMYYYRISSINAQGKVIGYSNIDSAMALPANLPILDETYYFSISPNPSTGNISLQSSEKIQQIDISNLNGQLIDKIIFDKKSNKIELDLSYLKNGTYFIKAYSDKQILYQKIFMNN